MQDDFRIEPEPVYDEAYYGIKLTDEEVRNLNWPRRCSD